jgi:hypothetical protein
MDQNSMVAGTKARASRNPMTVRFPDDHFKSMRIALSCSPCAGWRETATGEP